MTTAQCSDINTSTSIAKGALIKTLSTLMRDLWKDSGETEQALNTAPLNLELQRRAALFRGHQQQDAQEFILHLLEGLHEDVNPNSKLYTSRTQTATADIEDSLSDMQMTMKAWQCFLRNDDSIFVELFVGQLKSTLMCTVCGNTSVTFDPFWDLSVPIPSRMDHVRLPDCFDLFTKEEVLDGDERSTCCVCQKRQKSVKYLSIHKFPHLLLVHLKRFPSQDQSEVKIDTCVDLMVNGLDLSPYSAEETPARYSTTTPER